MPKRAVLLINLGTPRSTEVSDVRDYLEEFLGDRRVIDAPSPIREYILYAKTLRTRPAKTAEAYKKIWKDEGSPLLLLTEELQRKLQERISLPIHIAMRYQEPSIASALSQLQAEGVEEVFLMPLYPHYAMSTDETVMAKVYEELPKVAPNIRIDALRPFYKEPGYIEALYDSAKEYLEKPYDFILFSYHGIPARHLRKGDPSNCHCMRAANCCETPSPIHEVCYRAQCIRTTHDIVRRAGIPKEKFGISFQSRFGKEPWLEPYTDQEFERLGREGKVKRLLVMCPAFACDCLETLEEIQMEGKEIFLEAGGESFEQIPCLNVHPSWLDFLQKHVEDYLTMREEAHAGKTVVV